MIPVEETCAVPPYAGDPAGVRRRLEDEGIPFIGSGAAAVTAALDKEASRVRIAAAGVAVPEAVNPPVGASGPEVARSYAAALPFPAVVKPVRGGGSRGVAFAADAPSLQAVVDRWRWDADGPLTVQAYVAGPEATVWVGGTGARARCARVAVVDRGGRPIFDRAAKAGVRTGALPAPPLHPAAIAAAAAAAEGAHRALGLASYSRADVVVDASGRAVVLEVNARPHLTPHGQASVGGGRPGRFAAFVARRLREAYATAPDGADQSGRRRIASQAQARNAAR
jgi:D-alanine-D-alanine ligase